MFRGISSINLDNKGRLAIPTCYREMLRNCTEGQLITVAVNERCSGEEGCLWLYPLPEWEMDGQGRLLLPENTGTLHGWINNDDDDGFEELANLSF